MKDKSGQNRRRRSEGNASELGGVRVYSNPGPDADDRLRRLFTLLVKHATKDRPLPSQADESSKEDGNPKG